MDSEKISELDALSTAENDDVFVVNDTSATATKKITKQNMLKEIWNNMSTLDTDLGGLESSIQTLQLRVVADESEISNISKYSTSEVKVGKWIDNKPIYRKVVTSSTMPNNSPVSIAHGISDIDTITKLEGYLYLSGAVLPIPYINTYGTAGYNMGMHADDTNIILYGYGDFTGYTANIIIEYTKTTD
jgi:hypothetical protein